jgi:hypothetical protein
VVAEAHAHLRQKIEVGRAHLPVAVGTEHERGEFIRQDQQNTGPWRRCLFTGFFRRFGRHCRQRQAAKKESPSRYKHVNIKYKRLPSC